MSSTDGGLALGPGEGKTIQVPGHPITYKATKEDTSSPSEKHGWRVLGGMMGPVQ